MESDFATGYAIGQNDSNSNCNNGGWNLYLYSNYLILFLKYTE